MSVVALVFERTPVLRDTPDYHVEGEAATPVTELGDGPGVLNS